MSRVCIVMVVASIHRRIDGNLAIPGVQAEPVRRFGTLLANPRTRAFGAKVPGYCGR